MHFSKILALSFSAVAMAAPAPVSEAGVLVERTTSTVCCPKGSKSGCKPVPDGQAPPKDTDVYTGCANILNIGLVNLVLCNILNDIDIDVPITVSLLNGLEL